MTSLTQQDADRLERDAWAALQRGDAASARTMLEPVRRTDSLRQPWLLIGQVEQAMGDTAAAEAAFSAQLAVTPRDLPTLLLFAAARADRGDDRAALTFYQTALNVASQPGARVDPALVPRLRAGQTFIAEAGQRFADHLERAVAAAGLGDGRGGARLRSAVDLLLGRSELYLQQPSMFYFPGLPQRPFYERGEFTWLPPVEAATATILGELEALLADELPLEPYVQRSPDRPPPANPLLNDPRWSAIHLWRGGERVEANASRCPATMAAFAEAPIPVIPGRSPMALFSVLRPGTHIQPHHGLLNTRLICHLPLIVPSGCALRVGAETREWRVGETLVFDDSFEHEAWNRGAETRVVLLFEIWRPEIDEGERGALTEMFTAIDRYQGAAVDAG